MGSAVQIIGNSSQRNYFINGAMDLAQRPGFAGTAGLTTSPVVSGADRWGAFCSAGMTGSPIYGVGTGTQTPNNLSSRILNINGTPTTTTDYLTIYQRVESIHARDLATQRISYGIWVFPQITSCRITSSLAYPTTNPDDWSGGGTVFNTVTTGVLTPGQWTFVSLSNVLMPASVQRGLTVVFQISNFGTAGLASSGVYCTEAMLNLGPAVNRFVRAGIDVTGEVILCQRYFEKSYNLDVPVGTANYFGAHTLLSQNNQFTSINFKVTKRVPPTMISYNPGDGNPNEVIGFGGGGYNVAFQDVGQGAGQPQSGSSVPNSIMFYCHWTADAEIV